jgi:TPR repeat protein
MFLFLLSLAGAFVLHDPTVNNWFAEMFSHCVFSAHPLFNSRRFPHLAGHWAAYTSPEPPPRSAETAASLKRAMRHGNLSARFSYGVCRYAGLGVARSEAKGLKHWDFAVRQGFSQGRCFCALALILHNRGEDALQYIQKAVRDGDPAGEFMYGEALLFGNGVPPDPARGVRYMERAAKQDYVPASLVLGACAAQGVGIPVNPERALQLFVQAAQRGDAIALYLCGLMWLYPGYMMDWKQAAWSFQVTADYGYAPAKALYARMLAHGQGVPADLRTACKYASDEDSAGLLHCSLFET